MNRIVQKLEEVLAKIAEVATEQGLDETAEKAKNGSLTFKEAFQTLAHREERESHRGGNAFGDGNYSQNVIIVKVGSLNIGDEALNKIISDD